MTVEGKQTDPRTLFRSVSSKTLDREQMDFFQSSNYQVNKRLLSYLGQWPLQKPRERFFFRSTTLLLVGSIVLPKVIKLVERLGDLHGMIQCFPVLGLHTISAFKFFNYSINAKKLKKLTLRIEEDWIERGIDLDDTILRRYAERGRQLTVIYACYLWATLWMYLLLPGIPKLLDIVAPLNQSRDLIYLYETEYFIDPDKYYFPILIHAYITMPVSVGIIIGFDTMFAVYVHHACGIFATLGARLKTIGIKGRNNESGIAEESRRERRDETYERIVSCIKMHRDAVEFARLLESSTSTSFLFVIGIGMLMITVTGFMTVTNLSEVGEALRFGSFTLGEVIHIFYLCLQGQLLMDHSENIFVDAYNVEWYDISLRSKRLLLVIMMRSLIPCRITAGKVYILSLQNFTTVMKTAMSYFTVLLSIR